MAGQLILYLDDNPVAIEDLAENTTKTIIDFSYALKT